jgi:hypothetical protein
MLPRPGGRAPVPPAPGQGRDGAAGGGGGGGDNNAGVERGVGVSVAPPPPSSPAGTPTDTPSLLAGLSALGRGRSSIVPFTPPTGSGGVGLLGDSSAEGSLPNGDLLSGVRLTRGRADASTSSDDDDDGGGGGGGGGGGVGGSDAAVGTGGREGDGALSGTGGVALSPPADNSDSSTSERGRVPWVGVESFHKRREKQLIAYFR